MSQQVTDPTKVKQTTGQVRKFVDTGGVTKTAPQSLAAGVLGWTPAAPAPFLDSVTNEVQPVNPNNQ